MCRGCRKYGRFHSGWRASVAEPPFGIPGWLPVYWGHVCTLQAGAMPHAQQEIQRSVDVFEHTQVMLLTIPSIRNPGIPKTCRELCPLEQDKNLGPDPAAGSYQDSHVPGTSMTMGKEAYGDFSSPWSYLDSRPLWKQKLSLKIPCSLCQLPKGSSHPMPPRITFPAPPALRALLPTCPANSCLFFHSHLAYFVLKVGFLRFTMQNAPHTEPKYFTQQSWIWAKDRDWGIWNGLWHSSGLKLQIKVGFLKITEYLGRKGPLKSWNPTINTAWPSHH